MKVKLQVVERINLLQILPREGDFLTLKIVRQLRESLSFKDAEHDKLKFKYLWRCSKCGNTGEETSATVTIVECKVCASNMENTGQITWNKEVAEENVKEVDMKNTVFTICADALKRLNDDKKLTDAHFNLYEIFCVEKAGEEKV